jgi:light-regulated signal transduction histidine kinase (bacteriophytochrome)
MSQEAFKQLADKLENVAKQNNYEVIKRTKRDEETVVVEAEHWQTGDKIQVTAKTHDSKINLNIEDENECRDILEEIAEAIGNDLVKSKGILGDTQESGNGKATPRRKPKSISAN